MISNATVVVPGETTIHELEPAAWAVVLDFKGMSLPQADALRAGMGLPPAGEGLPGSLFQWCSSSPDGVRITEVWRSRRHFFHSYQHTILPQVRRLGLPTPEISFHEVHDYLTGGPALGPAPSPDVDE